MREKLYNFIEPSDNKSIYDYFMIVVIIVSLVPLCMKRTTPILTLIDYVTACIFVADYIARLITADYKLGKGNTSFGLYPFTPLAIIDLVAILPTFVAVGAGFRAFKIVRLCRSFRVFRFFRYSKSMRIIVRVIKEQTSALFAVCALAVGYIFISALIVFNVEPNTFDSFFDAIYWATVSLTTVGYGDIYPTSVAGRIVTMMSSIVGIAIVALPAGIITAGYMSAIENNANSIE